MDNHQHPILWSSALLCLTVLTVACAPFVSGGPIAPSDILDASAQDYRIFWQLRVPRVLTGFCAGSLLSLCGVCFQVLFRNGLATPYTLGVSGGAALGVNLVVWSGASLTLAGQGLLALGAFGGSLLSSGLVYLFSRLRRSGGTETMLLAGVAVSFLFSSLILFFQYISNENQIFRTMRWMLGSVAANGYGDLLILAPLGTAIACALLCFSRELDLLALGDELAASRGVSINSCRSAVFLLVSLLVGALVSFCGPIGFVGMVCPHICRRLWGARHRRLSIMSMLFGGGFLVLCDTIGRCLIPPAEIPVGVITSIIGGPFFLIQLLANTRHQP